MTDLVRVAKAFADPTRVRILAALRGRELCVCDLCEGLGVGQSTLSTHLQVIRDAGLVNTRKQGKWVYYAPNPIKDPLVTVVFEFFGEALQKDRLIARDARALRQVKSRCDVAPDCCSETPAIGKRRKAPRP